MTNNIIFGLLSHRNYLELHFLFLNKYFAEKALNIVFNNDFRNVFTLGTCAPIVGSQVLDFANEKDMLEVSIFIQNFIPVINYNN